MYFLTPYEIFRLHDENEWFTIDSIECTISNMVPLTETMKVNNQGADFQFNNTMYGIVYCDTMDELAHSPRPDFEETYWHKGFRPMQFTDGILYTWDGDAHKATMTERKILPDWTRYEAPPGWTDLRTLYACDPYQNAESCNELRPGKNSCTLRHIFKHKKKIKTYGRFNEKWSPAASNHPYIEDVDYIRRPPHWQKQYGLQRFNLDIMYFGASEQANHKCLHKAIPNLFKWEYKDGKPTGKVYPGRHYGDRNWDLEKQIRDCGVCDYEQPPAWLAWLPIILDAGNEIIQCKVQVYLQYKIVVTMEPRGNTDGKGHTQVVKNTIKSRWDNIEMRWAKASASYGDATKEKWQKELWQVNDFVEKNRGAGDFPAFGNMQIDHEGGGISGWAGGPSTGNYENQQSYYQCPTDADSPMIQTSFLTDFRANSKNLHYSRGPVPPTKEEDINYQYSPTTSPKGKRLAKELDGSPPAKARRVEGTAETTTETDEQERVTLDDVVVEEEVQSTKL